MKFLFFSDSQTSKANWRCPKAQPTWIPRPISGSSVACQIYFLSEPAAQRRSRKTLQPFAARHQPLRFGSQFYLMKILGTFERVWNLEMLYMLRSCLTRLLMCVVYEADDSIIRFMLSGCWMTDIGQRVATYFHNLYRSAAYRLLHLRFADIYLLNIVAITLLSINYRSL